ncbi:MAG: hypothetical protein H5T46_00340 [Archaeoglobi archaeon]|nr:hypothetical protein [Candidatus Mnemosynella sp.]
MKITVLYQRGEFGREEKRKIEARLEDFGLEVEGEEELIKSARRMKKFLRVEIFRRLPGFIRRLFYAYASKKYPRCRNFLRLEEIEKDYWVDVMSIFEELAVYAKEKDKKNIIFIFKTPIFRVFDLKVDGGLSYSAGNLNLAICGSESSESLSKLIIHEIQHWRFPEAEKI